MKKLICSGVALVTMLFLINSCTNETKTKFTDEQKAIIVKEVTEQFNSLKAAITKLDFNEWLKYISKENFVSSFSSSGFKPTYNACIDSTRISFAARERHKTDLLDFRVTPLSPDLALSTEVGIWENWYKNGDYRKAKGQSTGLWKKETDGWKLIHIHDSRQAILEERLANSPQ